MTEKVAVIGFGVTGQAAVEYLCAQGKEPIVIDTRPAPAMALPADVEFYFEQRSWPNVAVAEAILSPGLPLDSCVVKGAQAAGVRVVSDIDVFFSAVSQPVIGVTGTNGKSTVTSWVAHCLNKAGLDALAGGNLGQAALTLAMQDADVYVMELSSFQLERSLHHNFKVATILNVSEDHIDQHGDMAGYVDAKQRINRDADVVVFNRQDPLTSTSSETATSTVSFGLDVPPGEEDWGIRLDGERRYLARGKERVIAVDALSLAGEHNVQNALATAAIAGQFVSLEVIALGLSSFSGLDHRFEKVASIAGVTFVNDSKATNVGATAAALAGFKLDDSVILIAGGDAKGGDIASLMSVMSGRVRAIIAIGQDAQAFEELGQVANIPCERSADLQTAVERAYEIAEEGNTVLLSPACASLDMFENYMERGRQFCDQVEQIAGRTASIEGGVSQ